jgi:hypothetical protein
MNKGLEILYDMFSEIKYEIKFLIYFFIILLLLKPIIYFFSKFNKKITIKDKYIRYRTKSSNYNIVDKENNIYLIDNLWFIGDFNRGKDYNKLQKGKTYDVHGYGFKVPFLDIFPKIYKINNI